MNQRIYELTAVNPGIQKPGIVRLLENKDIHFSHTGRKHSMQRRFMVRQKCPSRKRQAHTFTG